MLIVTYHAIDDRPSPISTSAAQLRADLNGLREAGFLLVSLDDCADWLAGSRSLPARAAVVTFDDGYESVSRAALPLLLDLKIPATVFVVAGRMGQQNDWPGQWKSIPRMPLLTDADVRGLVAAGVTIGAHSWSHRSLVGLNGDEARREIVDAGDRLEQVAGIRVPHYAYPYGHRTDRDMRLAAERYRTAVTASPGLVRRASPAHDLPRLDAHDLRIALRLRLRENNRLRPYLAIRRGLRRLRRRLEPAGR